MRILERAGRAAAGRARSRAGMTLLEVMIAISVLLITLAATTAGQLSSRNLTDTAAENSTAMSDLRACMEQLLLEDIDEMVLPGSDFPDGSEVTEFNVVTAGSSFSQGDVEALNDTKAPLALNLPEGSIVVEYPNYDGGLEAPDPLEIRLTYTWRTDQPTRAGDDGWREMSLVTVRTDRR
jgi:prepilin-type N-terminal cleavage/methylation domain-containing protein